MEDSPMMEVLTQNSEVDLSESKLQKVIFERAEHFMANAETMTMVGVRRQLEQDLGLEINSLDPFKKYIRQQVDQIFYPPKRDESAKDAEKIFDSSRSKSSEDTGAEEGSESAGGKSDGEKDKVKLRKEGARKSSKESETASRKKRKLKDRHKDVDNRDLVSKSSEDTGAEEGSESAGGNSDSEKDKVKVRKEGARKSSKESETASRKKRKLKDRHKDVDNRDSVDIGHASEDSLSLVPVQTSGMRKDKSALGYQNTVEVLKSTIKACGLSIAPVIYKKAKQLDVDEREAFIVKELEEILLREGLSRKPSEKEIRDRRKRKETAKELEGIDVSNIISRTRRRSTFNLAIPSKFETPAKKGSKSDVKENKSKEKKDEDRKENNSEAKDKKASGEGKEKEFEDKEEEEEEEESDDGGNDDEDEESEEFNEDGNEESD